MTPRERAEHYAKVFPKYPKLRYDSRWLDGVWVLGQDYRGSGLYGSYPPGYLKRLRAIFPEEFEGRVLHLCSGSLDKSVGGIRLELNLERQPPPDVYGDAHYLPFPAETFDLIVTDIPYSPADAKKYGTPMVNRASVMREAARVLKIGGHLIWLDIRKPMFRKSLLHWWGIIGIVRSTNHMYRGVTFYERRGQSMANVKAKIKAAAEKMVEVFAILLGEDEATVAEALKSQKKNTKVRETGGDDEDEEPAPKAKKKGPKPPVDDDDEDDEEETPKKKSKAAAKDEDSDDDDDEDDDDEAGASIPSDAKLGTLDRGDLKKLAVANGLEAAGKNRDDLMALLQEKRDGGKKAKGKKAAAADDEDDDDEEEAPKKKSSKAKSKSDDDDEDDEDEKPAKKKKAKVKDEDSDDDEDEVEPPSEDDYPKLKVMKADLEAFFKLNKDVLKAKGFFGGKVKKGVEKAERTYDEVMGDADFIKEDWRDNVWPEVVAKNWTKMKAEADAMDDEDDDE